MPNSTKDTTVRPKWLGLHETPAVFFNSLPQSEVNLSWLILCDIDKEYAHLAEVVKRVVQSLVI